MLEDLRRETALVEQVPPDSYRLHPLLRSYLAADLARHAPEGFPELQSVQPGGGWLATSRCTPCGTPSAPATGA